jgi:pimeloyl-ACP methyl ester carboxylesterase
MTEQLNHSVLNSKKKHIYFIPGTAANSNIFERIELPSDTFELHFIEWLIPNAKNEKIESYALRMCSQVKHKNPILVGVSFGGVIAQEMSKIITCAQIVLISSIKNRNELPNGLVFVKKSNAYKLFPSNSLTTLENIVKNLFGKKVKKRILIYQNYLSFRDPVYLKWAIRQVLHWRQSNSLPNCLHIHGDQDAIFPIKHIQNCTPIKDGTHVMILTKAKEISQILNQKLR